LDKLAFGPRRQQDNFRAAFTAAEGWGRFSQTVQGGRQENAIELRYGKLHLGHLALDAARGTQASKVAVTLDGRNIKCDGRCSTELLYSMMVGRLRCPIPDRRRAYDHSLPEWY